MGLRKRLLDINASDLKNAHKIMRALAILGITEEDVLKIKSIPEMERQITELQEFKSVVLRINKNEVTASKNSNKTTMEDIVEMFGGSTEEFNPDGKGN